MMVFATEGNNNEQKDFSFVEKELKNLKNIPRPFDAELYRMLAVSNTVISYWKEIGYIPPYYYLFWLLQSNRWDMYYEEYKEIYVSLIDKICEENKKIGEAVRDFYNLEIQGYEWFTKSNKDYVYFLSYSYADGSGDNIICTQDYDQVMEALYNDAKDNDNDITYKIYRYPVVYSEDGWFTGIDIVNNQGELTFDSSGKLKYVDDIRGYGYHPMSTMELTMPYITMPHPFAIGDIVSYKSTEGVSYGVVSSSQDTLDDLEARGVPLDGGDFLVRIELVYECDGKLTLGFDNLCPIYFEKYTDEIEYKKKDIMSSLGIISDILTGKSSYISDLRYFMRGW